MAKNIRNQKNSCSQWGEPAMLPKAAVFFVLEGGVVGFLLIVFGFTPTAKSSGTMTPHRQPNQPLFIQGKNLWSFCRGGPMWRKLHRFLPWPQTLPSNLDLRLSYLSNTHHRVILMKNYLVLCLPCGISFLHKFFSAFFSFAVVMP